MNYTTGRLCWPVVFTARVICSLTFVQKRRGNRRQENALISNTFARSVFAATLVMGCMSPAYAYVLTITPGARAIYLQVGNGTANANNTTVNVVSLTVPATAIGNAVAQQMTSNSTQSISFFDNFAVCTPPVQVYVGGYFRMPTSAGAGAVLTVSTPANLQSGTDTIPFNQISWTSTAIGNTTADIPAGTFAGSVQTLRTIAVNTWVENCLTFSYANTTAPAAGTYTGRATYTLTAP
jgi:hypothetical protein